MPPHQNTPDALSDQELTVAVIEALLDSRLPTQNKDGEGELYGQLLEDLNHCGIYTALELGVLLDEQYEHMMAQEKRTNKAIPQKSRSMARRDIDAYFTHVGLVRVALGIKWGTPFHEYLRKMSPQRKISRRRRRKQRIEAKTPGQTPPRYSLD
ncbi:hypothetical protein EON83_29510 [bacterium]|nr:MAG: hypothetical protein EON83_29510 [bacterium]